MSWASPRARGIDCFGNTGWHRSPSPCFVPWTTPRTKSTRKSTTTWRTRIPERKKKARRTWGWRKWDGTGDVEGTSWMAAVVAGTNEAVGRPVG